MEKSDQLATRLAEVLRSIDFDKRYYSMAAATRRYRTSSPSSLAKADFERALGETGQRFRYHSGEKFFGSETKTIGRCTLSLNVSFRHDQAQFILSVRTADGVVGGPFSGLAEDVALLRDPDFTSDPPYPTLPFSNDEQLREVVRLGMELYAEAERALRVASVCTAKG